MSSPRTLIYAPNWLGDAIMAMPAVQAWRKWDAGTTLTVLSKSALAPLWRMHESVDEVIELQPGLLGTWAAAQAVRKRRFSEALILPNSFRSALIPWLASVPRRRGFARQLRRFLLSEAVAPRLSRKYEHQCWEVADILLGEGWWEGEGLGVPKLSLRPSSVTAAFRTLGVQRFPQQIAVIPGAARGTSKRWPHFGETARRLAEEVDNLHFLVFGTAAESGLCHTVAGEIGPRAVSLAGKTSLQQFAAMLSTCQLALCNDSGGMHLASSVGTPAVAVFGMTDSARTGPIGDEHVIVRNESVTGSRDIAREDAGAGAVLAAIKPEQVVRAVAQVLRRPPMMWAAEPDDD